MQAASPAVVSNQSGPHPRLAEVVAKHLAHPFRKPVAAHTQAAYAQFCSAWNGAAPLILDAGCGTGESTARLAGAHADAFVIGIDQSALRLARGTAMPANALLLRADVTDFWRLMARDAIKIFLHTWFYPNPWPKAEHLRRRWYAHPAFADALALGGTIEIRSNWLTLMEEAQGAFGVAGWRCTPPQTLNAAPETAVSLHEKKYLQSGHAVYRVRADSTV
jgi:tRNA (guanine-N7-)-methyltransferase